MSLARPVPKIERTTRQLDKAPTPTGWIKWSAKYSRSDLVALFVELCYARLPHGLDPDVPLLGDALADGVWTAIWPSVAAYVPLAALMVGFLPPLFTSAISNAYAGSVLFVIFAVVGAILSGAIGVMLLAGYVAGSLLVTFAHADAWSIAELLRHASRLTVSIFALAIPTLLVPRVAHGFVPPVPARIARKIGSPHILPAGLYAISCAVLVFVWCRGLPTMIRPVVTFMARRPDIRTVASVTWHWQVVVFFAAAAAFARILLEERSSQSEHAGIVTDLKRRRWTGHQRQRILRRLPTFVRVALYATVATVLVAGTFEKWFDAIIVGGLIASLLATRVQLIRRIPAHWVAKIIKLPLLPRFAIGIAAAYLLSFVVVRLLWSTASMHALTVSTLLSLTLFTLLFPEQAQLPTSPRSARQGTPAGVSIGPATIALIFGSVSVAHAQIAVTQALQGFTGAFGAGLGSPGCLGLFDCYPGPSSAANASAAIAAVASIGMPGIWNPARQEQTDRASADSHAATGAIHLQHLIDAVCNSVRHSVSSSADGIHELSGSAHNAWRVFSKFAAPGTIHPHPNPTVRAAGGYIAKLPGGGVLGFRPFTKSGPPILDLHATPGFEWVKGFKYFG